jgi:WXG100 family type VII secretion target
VSQEGAAEKVYEAGIELVNPGGRPDVLRAAAKGWRTMGEELDEAYTALDKKVQNTLGEHWRGDSAEAFRVHWTKIGQAVDETLPLFEQAAKGLEEAADNIEEINDEIHKIYIEIGVSIGASVALSFVTLGFSAAAGAANAARLGIQAANAASKLGRLLSMAARVFRSIRTFAQAGKWQRLTVELGVQWAAGTGAGVATSLATGKGAEFGNNLVNGAVGALGGKYIGAPLGARLGGGILGNSAGGMTAGAAASVAGDTVNNLRSGDELDASQMGLGALAGGLTGGAGSAAVHRATDGQAFSGAHGLAGDVATNSPIAFGLGAGGNVSKDIDAAINGDPNADKDEDQPGAASDARRDAGQDAKALQDRDRPDPARYGAFG